MDGGANLNRGIVVEVFGDVSGVVRETPAGAAHDVILVAPGTEFSSKACGFIGLVTAKDTEVGLAVGDVGTVAGEGVSQTGGGGETGSLG